jgi:outer membrane receptor protein involved in Fe transport
MKKYFLTALTLLGLNCYSQSNLKKECQIIDIETQLPILNGKYVITSKTDTFFSISPLTSTFSIDCSEYLFQTATLTIISPEYDKLSISIDSAFCLSKGVYKFNLKRTPKTLETVTIKSSLIKQDIDKITYNVIDDPDSKILNVLEFFPKLPFISLSPDDNPLFKGKSNFIILLNGKRTALFSGKNLRDVLKAISASIISKIEIITDPPARYENEGYSGVINIITPKNPANGYNGSINSTLSTFVIDANGSLNFRKDRFGAIAELGASFERTPFNGRFSETSTPTFKIFQTGKNKITNFSRNINTLFSYEIDSLNLVTIDVGISAGTLKNRTQDFAETKSALNPVTSAYLFSLNQQERSREISLNLNYQKNFKRAKDRFLTFSYLLDKNRYNEQLSNELIESQNFNGLNFSQISRANQTNNSMQLDYVHPIKKLKIDGGVKFLHRNFSNDYITENENPLTGVANIDAENTNELNYIFSILGIYNSYTLKFKSFSFRSGLRFESTRLNGNFKFGNLRVAQTYNNFLPSLKVQYKSTKGAVYGISYKQQIQRPGVSMLNPLVVKSAPGFNSSGNPNLKPVLLNTINVDFSKYDKTSISIALNYTYSKNTIQNVANAVGDSVILTTLQNIGKYKRFGFENSFEFPLTSKIDLSIDGSLNYVLVKGSGAIENLSNNGIEAFIYSYLTYKVKRYRFFTNVGFYGPTVNIQAISNSYFYSSIGSSVQLFNNKASLSFRILNPFTKYRKIISETHVPELTQFSQQNNLFRGVFLSFNYRFGKLEEEVKLNKRSIQIDDAARQTGTIK